MNAKERIIQTLLGNKTDQLPVTVHSWGLYKYYLDGIITGYENEENAWSLNGRQLADVETHFYERFRQDSFHLGEGASNRPEDPAYEEHRNALAREVRKLENGAAIDEYVKLVSKNTAEVLESGVYDHVKLISAQYGETVFIALNEGNPFADALDPHGVLGFEDGLIALLEEPDLVERLIYGLYDAKLQKMKALQQCGAHAYIGSETYCSADIISPSIYREIVYPAQKRFYTGLKQLGLYSISYFLGDLFPMLEDIKTLGIDALLVERHNKALDIDVAKVYEQAEGAFTLFGNLNSVDTLQKGTREEVVQETLRQTRVCNNGKFIMSNDCPVSFGTPEENIRAMIDTVRSI